jgi:hypothetical protein
MTGLSRRRIANGGAAAPGFSGCDRPPPLRMSVAPVSKAGVGTLTPRKDADIVMLAADRLVAQQRAWRRRQTS